MNILESIGRRPARSIEWLLGVFTLLTGLFIVSPFYSPPAEVAPAIHHSVSSHLAIIVYGMLLVSAGTISLIALRKGQLSTQALRVRIWTMFFLFLFFTFFAIIRLIFYSALSLAWTPSFLLALIAGVIYLGLRWESK